MIFMWSAESRSHSDRVSKQNGCDSLASVHLIAHLFSTLRLESHDLSLSKHQADPKQLFALPSGCMYDETS